MPTVPSVARSSSLPTYIQATGPISILPLRKQFELAAASVSPAASSAAAGASAGSRLKPSTKKARLRDSARFVGVVADITTRKRIERKAQRLSQQLLTIQEEERRSIAQELHDSTVQHLVATSLVLSTVSQQHGRNLEQAVATAESSLQEAIRELRTFSYLMHPPALQQQGLCKTLAAYVGGFADRSGLLCKLRMDRKHAKYPPPVQRTILRIVQEGLANAYRHASASRVSIDVRRLGARLHIVSS